MEKNAVFAVILSALVFILYFQFFAPPTPVPINVEQTESQLSQKNNFNPVNSEKLGFVQTESQNLGSEQLYSLENELISAKFSNHNTSIKSWKLKNFNQTPDSKSELIDLFSNVGSQLPLSLLLVADAEPVPLRYELQSQGSDKISMLAKTAELSIEKNFQMNPKQKYTVDVEIKLNNFSDHALVIAPGLRLFSYNDPSIKPKGFFIFKQPVDTQHPIFEINQDIDRLADLSNLSDKNVKTGDVGWIGIENRYFLSAILPRSSSQQNRIVYGKKQDIVYTDLQYSNDVLSSGQTKSYQFSLYLGPKDLDLLKPFNLTIHKSVDLGIFSIVGEPLLKLLKFLYWISHSWGLAIILLTILIKLALHPISKKSMKSMKAMQELQPKLKDIREKYKNDKQRLNVETMNLFKLHKVNPAGGCLPMLMQMPIYIALYNVFYTAIELYHAPFLFYKDLAGPDPYFISPVLLGVFLFLQQKLTPQANMDPAQQKAMMFMPIMFSFFLIYLPTGLVIYIFINTLMSVVQQYMMQHNLSVRQLFSKK